MRQFFPAVALIGMAVSMIPSRAHAQDSTKAPAVEAAVGTSVAERALVGAAESFPAGTASVVCFTKITGAADSEIEHVWYMGETEMARVKLPVKGSPYRTYSSKKLPADAKGDWRCDVVQAGKVLTSVKFKVE
ncbi:MAG TPA: DUF2914 domain-containing protein [Gemmatimonadaceae bacterium]